MSEKNSNNGFIKEPAAAYAQEAANDLTRFASDFRWVIENRARLLNDIPEEWIAVRNGVVIAHHPDFLQLLTQIPDPADFCIEYITNRPLEAVD